MTDTEHHDMNTQTIDEALTRLNNLPEDDPTVLVEAYEQIHDILRGFLDPVHGSNHPDDTSAA